MKLFVLRQLYLLVAISLVTISTMTFALTDPAEGNKVNVNKPKNSVSESLLNSESIAITINKYQESIDKIESQEGIYGQGLAQKLASLGDLYQRNGQYQQAVDVLKRSFHLYKVNDGLYSSSQVPILIKLIANLKALKQWKLVNERYQYLYWLSVEKFGDGRIETLDTLLTISDWYLTSYKHNQALNMLQTLLDTYWLLNKAEQLIIKNYGKYDVRLIKVYNDLLILNYYIATNENISFEKDISRGSTDEPHVAILIQNLIKIKVRAFNYGRDIIKREIDVYDHQKTKDYLSISKAQLKFADWHLMYHKRNRALKLYKYAYDYSIKVGYKPQVMEQLFNQPVPLPAITGFEKPGYVNFNKIKLSADDKYVHVNFNITKLGQVRHITFIESVPSGKKNVKKVSVLRDIRYTKFRPRIIKGQATETKDVQYYVFQTNED